mmetsp:Transcript_45459/g.108494  ORF Transcript_45459/g.108494 Transcript_45459/m.108494 type:complete len:207 (-) Transcript_45459:86-706(-)
MTMHGKQKAHARASPRIDPSIENVSRTCFRHITAMGGNAMKMLKLMANAMSASEQPQSLNNGVKGPPPSPHMAFPPLRSTLFFAGRHMSSPPQSAVALSIVSKSSHMEHSPVDHSFDIAPAACLHHASSSAADQAVPGAGRNRDQLQQLLRCSSHSSSFRLPWRRSSAGDQLLGILPQTRREFLLARESYFERGGAQRSGKMDRQR